MPHVDQDKLPLLPLKTLVFPRGILLLKVFEQRYLEMIKHCTKVDKAFVICPIKSGEETLADTREMPEIYKVGTTVKMIDFEQLANGVLSIAIKAEKKVLISQQNIQHNNTIQASVEYFPEEQWQAIPEKYQILSDLLKKMFPDIIKHCSNVSKQHFDQDYDDAVWVAARLIEALPLDLMIKVRLFLIPEPIERLKLIYQCLQRMKVLE